MSVLDKLDMSLEDLRFAWEAFDEVENPGLNDIQVMTVILVKIAILEFIEEGKSKHIFTGGLLWKQKIKSQLKYECFKKGLSHKIDGGGLFSGKMFVTFKYENDTKISAK